MELYKEVGEFIPDKLFASTDTNVITKGVKLKENQGILNRGSVIAFDNNDYVLAGSTSVRLEGILTDTIDTEKEQITTMYMTGHFNKSALIFSDNAVYDDFEQEFRKLNIFASAVKED